MNKTIKEKVDYSEEVLLCPKCLVEAEYGSNDLDSFHSCPKCDACDFHERVKWIKAKREQVLRYVFF